MGLLSRILGISRTKPPADLQCWSYADGKVEIDLSRATELADTGGAVRLEGGGLPMRVLVIKDDQGEYRAYHNKCTHMGRRIDVLPGQLQLECCSVNKSKFDVEGKQMSGPTKGPLKSFPTAIQDGRLIVDLSIGGQITR